MRDDPVGGVVEDVGLDRADLLRRVDHPDLVLACLPREPDVRVAVGELAGELLAVEQPVGLLEEDLQAVWTRVLAEALGGLGEAAG